MTTNKRRLIVNPKPFSLDQFIAEQPNDNIGLSKRFENTKLKQKQGKNVIDEAFHVIELMAVSTGNVLDHTDKLSELVQDIKKELHSQVKEKQSVNQQAIDLLTQLHKTLFEMIASQSYQDVARQKMELVINNLEETYQQLKNHNQSLEEKVTERTLEIEKKNKVLQNTLIKVEWANKKIMNSIRYAQIIQS